jgi:hypothetical protein
MRIWHDIRREYGGTPSAPVEETIDYVPFRAAETWSGYMLHPDRIHRWAPVTPALYHLALVHVHGRTPGERAETQVVRRLQ